MPPFDSLEFLFDHEPRPAPVNMAMDEILLEEVSVPTLRVYRWNLPAASFGYFEKYSAVAAGHPGRELVRRWTGGGVVLHGEDFTYSILVPQDCPFMRMDVAESYRAIHERVAEAMQESGLPALIAKTAAPKVSQACFENPVRYDVLVDNHKIAGAAQRRTRFGLLHQGSIQSAQLSGDFGERLASKLADRVIQRAVREGEPEAAAVLAGIKYGTDAWLRRF